MAMHEFRGTITEAEVVAFGHKLAEWADELSQNEREILSGIIGCAIAAAEGEDVQGYDWLRSGFTLTLFPGLLNSSSDDRDRRRPPDR
jgi:hypothetical protein